MDAMATMARVLVVDDERFFREAISEVLSAHEFPCAVCEDGEQALKLAGSQQFAVAVLDVEGQILVSILETASRAGDVHHQADDRVVRVDLFEQPVGDRGQLGLEGDQEKVNLVGESGLLQVPSLAQEAGQTRDDAAQSQKSLLLNGATDYVAQKIR